MRNSMIRTVSWLAVAALVGAGCSSSPGADQPMSAGVSLREQWAAATEDGMAAVFGTLANRGPDEVRIVSGTSPAASRVEVHEVASDAGGPKTMRTKAGGITIAAGGTHELVPGGDHLMLMDLTAPLAPGADVGLTVVFSDGSALPVSAQVRDFAGANEDYQPANPPEHDHG